MLTGNVHTLNEDILSEEKSARCIGQKRCIFYPPHLPDLMPLVFFFFFFQNGNIFKDLITINEIKADTENKCSQIPREMIEGVCNSRGLNSQVFGPEKTSVKTLLK